MEKTEVCGIAFDGFDAEEAVRAVLKPSDMPQWVVTPNALMLEECRKHPEYRELLRSASVVLPDGSGVLLAAKRSGKRLHARVAGIDFGEQLLRAAAERSLRVFLLGGADGVAAGAAEKLRNKIPGLTICGTCWGYFDREGRENTELLCHINACRPDILFVCLGFPVQERWIRDNLSRLTTVRVAAGLGGSLDVWSGTVHRAPALLRRCGLEWAWRMACQPKKLRGLPALLRFALSPRG